MNRIARPLALAVSCLAALGIVTACTGSSGPPTEGPATQTAPGGGAAMDAAGPAPEFGPAQAPPVEKRDVVRTAAMTITVDNTGSNAAGAGNALCGEITTRLAHNPTSPDQPIATRAPKGSVSPRAVSAANTAPAPSSHAREKVEKYALVGCDDVSKSAHASEPAETAPNTRASALARGSRVKAPAARSGHTK